MSWGIEHDNVSVDDMAHIHTISVTAYNHPVLTCSTFFDRSVARSSRLLSRAGSAVCMSTEAHWALNILNVELYVC